MSSSLLSIPRRASSSRRLVASATPLLHRRFLSVASSSAADAAAASPAAAAAARSSEAARRPSMKEASSESAQRSFALRLYKALLRSHRAVLPEAMRSLGDAYVREEFQLHKTAKPQHLNGFFTQWIQCQTRDQREQSLTTTSGRPLQCTHASLAVCPCFLPVCAVLRPGDDAQAGSRSMGCPSDCRSAVRTERRAARPA